VRFGPERCGRCRLALIHMFPYFETSDWHVGPVPVHSFIILVALGCLVGWLITARRAARDGFSQEQISELALWMFGVGFAGANLMTLAYVPRALPELMHHLSRFMTIPWGLSSFGGFAGGLIGAALFFRVHRISRDGKLAILDAVAFAVPFGWAIGRMGCYLVHDHPGIRTSSWLGVRYPGGTRYDLALLEIVFLFVLGAAFLILGNETWPRGLFGVVLFLSYGTFRLLEDRVTIDPDRYFGWSVDQISAAVMIALGLAGLAGMNKSRMSGCIRYVISLASFGSIRER
jgi:phosphatidylglycerol:prolipoprotein diacylglycerol transferase